MASINFYLKNPKSTTPTRIYLQTLYKGTKLKYTTSYKVKPVDWNSNKQIVKAKNYSGYLQINKGLKDLSSLANDVYNQILASDELLNPINFRQKLDEHLNKIDYDFFEYFEDFISNRSDLAKNTITDYKQTYIALKEFEFQSKTKIKFENIDLNFYDKLKNYVLKKQGYSKNTFGKRIKVIKTVMKYSFDRGLHKNMIFQKKQFKVLKTTNKRPFLNIDDIFKIKDTELNSTLDKYRDIFIILCFLGIRFSDLNQVTKHNISIENNINRLTIKQNKTKDVISIPIHEEIIKILKKYDYIIPKVSEQNLNKNIKIICKQASISKEYIKDGITLDFTDHVSSHDGRRSFATNAFLKGLPVSQIMEITGHKKESSFLTYVQEKKTPQAKELFSVFD